MTETDEKENTVEVKFIRDEPADDDFFSTHTRLARAIVDTLRDNAEIKVVGLLGRWGSGKSTVAKKVGELLTGPKESHFTVFTYDAWLHQNDPIRRSFLESLLRSLVATATVLPGKWDERLKELNGEIHDTDVVETPTLSDEARWFVLSLIPVPVGVGLIGLDTIKEAWGSSTTPAGIATFWLAILLTVMPLWVWLIRYLVRRPWRKEPRAAAGGLFSKRFWKVVDDNGTATSLLPLFLNRSVTRSSTRTFRSPEPSSLEFGRTFQAIMKEATQSDRRFVIVIDNLDRVAEDEALQMWATIRSFFLAAHETDGLSHEPYHPTVILPIDRHAIEQMFGAPENRDIGRDRATSFISKTFDVTFEVTEPVTSDWRAFLERQMQQVFGERYEPRWGFWTRRIFEQGRPKSQATVTPREINKLVNRIGALFLQWHDGNIAVEVMAFYVVRRKDFEDGLLAFLQTAETEFARDISDWKLQLAALHYGVPLDKAAQVLLEQPIRDAISTLDRDEFEKLSRIEGFGDTFEIATTNLPPGSGGGLADFQIVTNAALLLASVPASDEVWAQMAWANLTDLSLEIAGPDLVMPDLVERIDCLAEHMPPASGKYFVDHAASGISGLFSRENLSDSEIEPLRAAATRLIDYAEQAKLEAPTFSIEGEAPAFLKRLSQIARRRIWARVRTELAGEILGQGLIEMLRSPNSQVHAPGAIQALVNDKRGETYGGESLIEWSAVADAAAEIVRNPDQYGIVASPGIAALGYLANYVDEARTGLTAICDDGVMTTRLNAAYGESKWETLHNSLSLLIWRGANFSPPPEKRWREIVASRPNFVPSVLQKLRMFFPMNTMELVWNSYHAAYSSRELTEAIIRHMVETGDLGPLNLNQILSNIYKYRDPVPWRLRDRFIGLLEARGNFWDQVAGAPMGQSLHDAAVVLATKGVEQEGRIHDIVQGQVEGAKVDDWVEALRKGVQPFEMATGFLKSGSVRMKAGSALFTAMIGQLDFMATVADHRARERWFTLAHLLRPKPGKDIAKALGLRLLETPAKQALNLLKAGGPEFLKAAAFSENAGQSIEHIMLKQLRTKGGREWLKDNGQEIRLWLQRSPKTLRKKVEDELRQHASSNSEERRYSAEIIRRNLGLRGGE